MDCFFFFFKQKTAYEMRISDWSSDVCSSDLLLAVLFGKDVVVEGLGHGERGKQAEGADIEPLGIEALARLVEDRDRRGALLRLHGHCNRPAQDCSPRHEGGQQRPTARGRGERKSGVWGKSGCGRAGQGGGR